jgi:arginine/ornithine transport system substrate-binding protein
MTFHNASNNFFTKTLAAVLFLAASAVHAQAPEWKKIRIGVEGAFPPFSQLGTDGKLKGFDIDMANALCAEMKAECTLAQQDWDGMIPALNSRKFDAIIASMSITDERKKQVAFSDKYYQTPARFVAKTTSKLDATPMGLKGKKIGVQRTTTQDRYVTELFKDSEIKRYAKQDEAFLDLVAGRVDTLFVDSVAANDGFLKTPQGKAFGFYGPLFKDEKYFGLGAGVAMRKADSVLRDKFNAAIKAIRASGEYTKLQNKYFDFDVYGDVITEAKVMPPKVIAPSASTPAATKK